LETGGGKDIYLATELQIKSKNNSQKVDYKVKQIFAKGKEKKKSPLFAAESWYWLNHFVTINQHFDALDWLDILT